MRQGELASSKHTNNHLQSIRKIIGIINSIATLITFFPQINAVFEKGTVLSNASMGVSIDSELNFENYIWNICSKVSKKLNALGRIAGYITLEKRRMLLKAFIESQFNYCSLIWMLHSLTMNNKINRLWTVT